MALLFASLANAQTEKGGWTVGAQVGSISYSSQQSNKSFTVLLSPSIGYFVAKNVVVGASIPGFYSSNRFSSLGQPSFNTYESTNTQIGLSPYVRVYFGESKLRPFVNASIGYNQQWLTNKSGLRTTKSDNSYLSYGVSAGGAYFINNNVSFDASLGYTGGEELNIADFFNNGTTQPKSIGLSVGLRIFFGQ